MLQWEENADVPGLYSNSIAAEFGVLDGVRTEEIRRAVKLHFGEAKKTSTSFKEQNQSVMDIEMVASTAELDTEFAVGQLGTPLHGAEKNSRASSSCETPVPKSRRKESTKPEGRRQLGRTVVLFQTVTNPPRTRSARLFPEAAQ